MRLQQIHNQYLYEGLDRSSANSMLLWESAGIKLREAALTADQIQQIFQNVEQGATAAGGNRTMLGKGKDAAEAVNKAWEDLKTKIQDSKPIKNVDNAYDSAVAKIEAGLGGPDNAVSKIIMGYRKFAKEHPIAQGFIYSALIAAAGISGAGLGGAAVLGLLKMADKLLQGEKFSSAAYSGAKTGAMAYGASKLGDYLKGKPEGDPSAAGADTGAIEKGLASDQAFQDRILNKFPPDKGYSFAAGEGGKSLQVFDATGRKVFSGDIPLKTMDIKTFADLTQAGKMATPGISSGAASSMPMVGVRDSIEWTGKALSEGQVYMIFNRVARQELTEGPLDALKGMAGKAADWAKTKGKNLTTKVTADKLNSAWKKAGSPMDSDQLAAFLQSQGVDSGVVDKVYADLKLPAAGDPQKDPELGAEQPTAAADDGKKDPTLDPEQPAAAGVTYKGIKELVLKLDKKGKQRIAAYLQKQLGTA